MLALAALAAGCSSRPQPAPDAQPTAVASPVPSAGSALPGEPSPAPPSTQGPGAAPAYVALGDSVAAGVGALDPAVGGYVPVLARLLSPQCDGSAATGCALAVRNLSLPGATTASLQRDQLPQALALLQEQPGVRLVTVTVGGNDVFAPILQSCGAAPEAPTCRSAVVAALERVDTGIDEVLRQLESAAPPGTVVAVMTYYDPLPACRLSSLQPLSQQVLEGTGDAPGLNDVLRARAAEHGAVVVETADRLVVPDDLVGDLDCLHPSGSGHERIAEAFADAVAGRLR